MDLMGSTVFEEMVTLTPAGWMPDPRLTAGNIPFQQILITRYLWVSLGRPATIEEYQKKLAERSGFNTIDFRGFRAEVPI